MLLRFIPPQTLWTLRPVCSCSGSPSCPPPHHRPVRHRGPVGRPRRLRWRGAARPGTPATAPLLPFPPFVLLCPLRCPASLLPSTTPHPSTCEPLPGFAGPLAPPVEAVMQAQLAGGSRRRGVTGMAPSQQGDLLVTTRQVPASCLPPPCIARFGPPNRDVALLCRAVRCMPPPGRQLPPIPNASAPAPSEPPHPTPPHLPTGHPGVGSNLPLH